MIKLFKRSWLVMNILTFILWSPVNAILWVFTGYGCLSKYLLWIEQKLEWLEED